MRQVLVLGVVLSATVARADALDKPSFTATPSELLAAAGTAAIGDDVGMIREDVELQIDDRGRLTTRWRSVFVIRTQNGANTWDTLGSDFRPSFQDRPHARARVIDPSGRVSDLDPAAATDQPVVKAHGDTSDSRELSAPLPKLAIGSVVEEEIVTVDRDPESAAGRGKVWSPGTYARGSFHITMSAPAAAKPRHIERELGGVHPKHAIANGRETWTYVFAPAPKRGYERDMPSDVAVAPMVGITTVASWANLAHDLSGRVDKQLAAGPMPWPAEVPKAATPESMRAVITWLKHHVQANQIGVDAAPLVPATPAETLKHGSADDFAIAVALVALLRQAGIAADVVLVAGGPGFDLDPQLPELDGFDRVIVRAQLGATTWIDPTSDFYPTGKLPAALEGRRSLVLDAATTDLITTPRSSSTDNTVREIRTFDLVELGFARVSETHRSTGIREAEEREHYANKNPTETNELLTALGKRKYDIEKLDASSTTDPFDLATPFTISLAGKDSSRAHTQRARIDVTLAPASVLYAAPYVIYGDDSQRVHDFVWPSQYVYEVEYDLVVPDGFSMPAIADRTIDAGTAKLTETQRIDGRRVIVTFRFESGKQRLTAAEVMATRQALKTASEQTEQLVFPNTARELAGKGKYREALAELDRMIRLHPTHGHHHADLAEILTNVGMTEAARREMKKALALERNDADLHVMFGWVLAHDDVGRIYGFDHDHAAARAELETARKLDPKHVGAAVELGKLLERDRHGRLHEPSADLAGAARAWRAAYDLDASTDNFEGLLRTLIWTSDFAGAEKIARAAQPSATRDALLVTATTALSGVPAGLKEAGTLASNDARAKAIASAASILMLTRHYDEARGMFAEAGALTAGSGQAQAIAKLARRDQPLDRKTPEGAVIEAELDLERDGMSKAFWDTTTADEIGGALRKGIGVMPATMPVLTDIMRTTGTTHVEGDAAAWRVDFETGGVHAFVYAAMDHGTIKVIGEGDVPAGLGRHVFRLLAKGDLASAQRCLDWAAKDSKEQLFKLIWSPNHGTDRESTELAAAVLTGDSDGARALPILKACVGAVGQATVACGLGVTMIDVKRDAWADLDAYATTRLASKPDDVFNVATKASAALHVGGAKEAIALLDAQLAKTPDEHLLLSARIEAAVANNDIPDAIQRATALTKQAKASGTDYNNLAWLLLGTNTDLPGALVAAHEAVRLQPKNASAFHTLAAIEAELGDVHAAHDDDLTSMRLHVRDQPAGDDWYVEGRIAEQLGLRDDAIADYRRVKRRPIESVMASSYDLAQRRLTAIGKP